MLEVDTEYVLVVPTEVFHSLGHFQGLCFETKRYLAELLQPSHMSYRPRSEMEADPSYKQLIPYCIFRHLDATGRDLLFQYTRGKGQGEGRLHHKRSIGIGGHISSADYAGPGGRDAYAEGLRRELDEEVVIQSRYTQRSIGLINDDLSAVGKVHLGIVHLFELEEPAVAPREAEILEASFRPAEELLAQSHTFETWSQICLQALFTPGALLPPALD